MIYFQLYEQLLEWMFYFVWTLPPTFLLVLQFVIPLAAAARLAARGVCAEGALANE